MTYNYPGRKRQKKHKKVQYRDLTTSHKDGTVFNKTGFTTAANLSQIFSTR